MKNIKLKFITLFLLIFIFSPINKTLADEIIPPPSCETDPTLCTPPPTCETDPTLCPPPVLTENVLIRNGENIIFQGPVDLPTAGNVDITDNAGIVHSVNTNSVLGFLYILDQNNDSFSLSNLQYYDSFGAFYLKCILPNGGEEACDNWQYVVGGTTPWQSIDQSILVGGENVGIYFGSPYKTVLSANEINTTDVLTATAQKYDYENNLWNNRTGVTIGLTQTDPNNPWTPIEVQTILVDENGQASFSNISAGSYNVGIKEDYYFPTEPLTVNVQVENNGGGGGGGNTILPTFSVPNAISYLESVQGTDGSFGNSSLYTDWASIALASGSISESSKNKILSYMSAHNTPSSNLTDNERRIMALLSLNKNPYDFEGINYISSILNSFDGTQFGDMNLVNDDVFALIPLANSGYTNNDEIISKDIAFIISKQKSNGSWEESIDMTSASILALSNFPQVSGVSSALNLAKDYLISMQNADGGWENVFSTSWVLQAESALGVSWKKNEKTGSDYLAINQNIDGGVLNTDDVLVNRIWATSYAIPAVLGKTWNQIFSSFSKPTEVIQNNQITQNVETPVIPVLEIQKTVEETKEIPVEKPVKKIVKKTKVVQEVQPKIETENVIEQNQLTASAENSGIKIPKIVYVFFVLILGGFVVFRFIKK